MYPSLRAGGATADFAISHRCPFQRHISFSFTFALSTPPNITISWRAPSYTMVLPNRGDGPVEATRVQSFPFHSQVSPYFVPVLSMPPNSTITRRPASYAIAPPNVGGGPAVEARSQRVPSNSHVVPVKRIPTSPPNRTYRLRAESYA